MIKQPVVVVNVFSFGSLLSLPHSRLHATHDDGAKRTFAFYGFDAC